MSSNRKTILIFVDWFWPGYLAGGPIQSVISIINRLKDTYNFKVITSDRDLHAETSYAEIKSNMWIWSPVGCEVFYLSPGNTTIKQLRKLILETPAECVYINGLFSLHFSILPLFLFKALRKKTVIVIAPRGMLGRGALAIKKNKKQLFLFVSKLLGLYKNVDWHATSEQEKNEILQTIHPRKEIAIIPNFPKSLTFVPAPFKKKGFLNLCFISRITPKKNLRFAIELLSQINCSIIFKIYGPIEDQDYWEKCLQDLTGISKNITANYEGTINPNDISTVFSQNHVMLLPTQNENFGHAIIESLSCGCPVIISDQTPWNDLEQYNAGFALALKEKDSFVSALKYYCDMEQDSYEICRRNAVQYVKDKINVDSIISQYKTFFNDRIKNGSLNI